MIVGSAVLRILYAVAVMEPIGSGPDGPAYHEAATAMLSEGVLASVPRVPYWPPGYPMLITAIYAIVGIAPKAVAVFQIVAVAASTIFFYRWIERTFGWKIGLLTVLLLTVSPAFGASQTVLMYEPLQAAVFMLAVPLVAGDLGRSPATWRLIAGAGVLAFGIALQPKMLLAGLLFIGWWLWRWRRWGAALVAVVVLALGPGVLIARNYVAEGHAVMSANLGNTLEWGFDEEFDCAPYEGIFERDRVLTRCAIEWMLDHPGEAVVRAGGRAVDYWRPLVGPLRDGTWFHAFDVRRLVPRSAFDNEGLRALDMALSVAWMVGLVVLIVAGGRRVWLFNPALAWLVLIPVLSYFLVSVAIIGDARMRLPTAPLYSILIAAALTMPWTSESPTERPAR